MSRSVSQVIVDRVREAMTTRNVSSQDRGAVTQLAQEFVAAHQTLAAGGVGRPLQETDEVVAYVVSAVCGLGVLETVFDRRRAIEDVFIEGARVTYFEEGHLRAVGPTTEEDNVSALRQLLAGTDASLDRASPIVDGVQVLDEGRARLTAAIPPASPKLTATIRLYVDRSADLSELVERDMLTSPAANLLALTIRAKGSVLISGETGSGKSTLLASLLGECQPNHNVRLMEEARELQFRPAHGGRMNCVPAGPDGRGGIDLAYLLRINLRMRPDFCIVGEVRGAESWGLARAARVGAGFAATIHATDTIDALEALVTTGLEAGPNITPTLIRDTFSRAISFVVHVERDDPNLLQPGDPYRHQITAIRAVIPLPTDGRFASEVIFRRERRDEAGNVLEEGLGIPMVWTGRPPPSSLVRRLERLLPTGVNITDVLKGTWGGEG